MKPSPMIAISKENDKHSIRRRIMAAEREYDKNRIKQLQDDNRRLRAIDKAYNVELQKIGRALASINEHLKNNEPSDYYKMRLAEMRAQLNRKTKTQNKK